MGTKTQKKTKIKKNQQNEYQKEHNQRVKAK